MKNPNTMHPVLYTPATTDVDKLLDVINGSNPDIHRMVVCTEDSVSEDDVPLALDNLRRMSERYDPGHNPGQGVEVFVRARNPEVLGQILDNPTIERVAGFVVPKADPVDYPKYADLINKRDADLRIMPILESPEMTDAVYRADLLDVISASEYRDGIDCLRIGANDLLGHQGMRRPRKKLTIYGTVIGRLMDNIVNEFRGNGGFDITAPVFECFAPEDDPLFMEEAVQNIANRLFGQTVIHPRHVKILNNLYRVCSDDLASAREMCGAEGVDVKAVNGKNGRMDEVTTHSKWAANILLQAEMFGVVDPPSASVNTVPTHSRAIRYCDMSGALR